MSYLLSIFLILASWLEPRCPLRYTTVDLIELNHCYNDNAEIVFNQYIFWKWDTRLNSYRVQAYRVLRGPHSGSVRGGFGWQARWCDNGVFRDVTASWFRETWTQYDPELEDRQLFSMEKREDL